MNNNTKKSSHYMPDELNAIGLAKFGEGLLIDRSVRFYNPGHIYIGSNVRIDAYCVLSASEAGIYIGNHVHLSVGVTMVGQEKITIEDFCGFSVRACVFSSNDDYSGGYMTNPTIPDEFRNAKNAEVIFRRHVIVGAGSIILPGVIIGIGASIGALSLVNKSVPEFMIVSGNPIRKIGIRDRRVLEKEKDFLQGITFQGKNHEDIQ